MSLLRDLSFRATAAGHFVVDLLNGQRSLLLATLSVPLGLSNSLIGAISTTYTLLGSALQPVFGVLADRIGPRWVATLGILWMGATFSAAVLLDGRIALLPLVLTAIGSGAFHPAGTMEATARGRLHFAGQAAFAASLFFLFGQLGLSIGPAVGGLIIDQLNPEGLTLLLVLVLPVGLNAGWRIPGGRTESGQSEKRPTARGGWRRVLPFATLIALRSWSQMTMIAFLPKYYNDLGFRPATLGVIAALFMGGSALGGVIGGWLGDRVDKRRLIATGLLLAGLPMALMPEFGPTKWAYLLVPLAGALSGSSHSLIVVLAQGLLPGYVGAASGAVLGFMFASGSFGALASGFLADEVGFGAVFLSSAITVVLAGLLAIASRSWNSED